MPCSPRFSLRSHRRLLALSLVAALPLLVPCAHSGVLDEVRGGLAKPSAPADAAEVSSLTPALALASATTLIPSNSPQSVSSQTGSDDPYDKLAQALASVSGYDKKLSVSLGDFLDEDSDRISTCSPKIKDELAIALPKTGKFEIITRERLADLQNEGKFQASDMVKSGSELDKVKVKAVTGIIRGHIHFNSPNTMIVYAQITKLDGGEIREVKIEIPLRESVVLKGQSIDPIQWLVDNKQERPTEVTLTKQITIPLVADGRTVGSMIKHSGTSIHVDDLNAKDIKTQISGVCVAIPVEDTNLSDLGKKRLEVFVQASSVETTANKELKPVNSNTMPLDYKASRFCNTKWMFSNISICFLSDGSICQWARWKAGNKEKQPLQSTHWTPINKDTVQETDGGKRSFTIEQSGLNMRQSDGRVWTIYN